MWALPVPLLSSKAWEKLNLNFLRVGDLSFLGNLDSLKFWEGHVLNFFYTLVCRSGPSLIQECYEILFLLANGHEDGIRTLYEAGGMHTLATQISTLADGI